MKLTNQFGSGWITSAQDVDQAIDALDQDNNPFTVLSRADEDYIQTAHDDGGWTVERRQGGANQHFSAWHVGGGSSFTKDEVRRLFEAYRTRGPDPMTVEWKPLAANANLSLRGFSWWKAALLLVLVAGLWWLAQFFRGMAS